MIKKLVRIIDILIYITTSLIMSCLIIVVLLQIYFRFILGEPLTWSEEIARFLFVWGIFLGSYRAVREGLMFGIPIILNRLPKRFQSIFNVVSLIISSLFLIIVLYEGSKLSMINMLQPSPAIRLPMGLVYAAIPVGALLMLFGIILEFFEKNKHLE